ncbi:DHHC zinc finger domain/ankyrin repeat containing protein [Babesia divergens]|uniref:Palmitoyltransferase n=1 Tax=Babesia divergens TaxID=32595 RepID=A0AAD9G914_BABDI|nr:DHHC zinc finger domain/ankyrin repeat containing protein [Babesia divergens]
MNYSNSFHEVSTDVPSNFDASESNVDYRMTYKPAHVGSDDHSMYMSLETKIISAASNRDHESLYKILCPLLDNNDVSQMDAICALHWSCYCGKVELVDRLLNAGCDPHYPDDINLETPIYFAIKGSNVAVVQMLVQRFGTEILCHENRRRLTPFLLAASEFMEDNVISTLHMLEFLYLSGVSLEEQDASGRTALMLASRRGCQFVVQWLLSRGANLAHRDHVGNSVLHHACHSSNVDTLRFLCKHGAIGLIGSKAVAMTSNEETALGICLMKRRYLQYAMLKVWSWQYALTGNIISFRSTYPIYYWFLAFVNLVMYYKIYKAMDYITPAQTAIVDIWVIGWVLSQCFWFITFVSDPGKARKSSVLSQTGRTSDNFEKDMMKDAPILGGTYESHLQSLQKQQELINYEFYRINNDSFRRNLRFPHDEFEGELREPLDPYGTAGDDALAQRMQVCKEETQVLQTEMHALYPQVGMERQEHCVFGYADAVMGTLKDLGIGTVCITCNMIRAPRSHHCGSCGVCMIRQDHHCAWVDNCIAKGNQRSFCIFIASICFSICHTYYVLYLHFARAITQMHFDIFWDGCYVIFGVIGNAAWLTFVVYLLLRITRNMITDVTFYEFLRKPEYVRKQFKGKVQGSWWDFAGLSVIKVVKNCLGFWVQG